MPLFSDESHQIEEIATHYFGMTVSNYAADEEIRSGTQAIRISL